jgi:hypothetical protein
VWQDWLTPGIDMRQILVETHNAPMPDARDFFFGLHDAGSVVFSKEANYENGEGGVEYGFVKLSTDFFIDDSMYYCQGLKTMSQQFLQLDFDIPVERNFDDDLSKHLLHGMMGLIFA